MSRYQHGFGSMKRIFSNDTEKEEGKNEIRRRHSYLCGIKKESHHELFFRIGWLNTPGRQKREVKKPSEIDYIKQHRCSKVFFSIDQRRRA